MSGQMPSEEELRAAMEEQMRRITVEDVLVQTAVTLINLGGRRLGLPGPEGEEPERPDMTQAKQAIDGARALLPLLPAEPQAAVRQALSQLQMAFAQLAQAPEGGEQPGEEPPKPGAEPGKPDDQAERAKARSKIWTPPGT